MPAYSSAGYLLKNPFVGTRLLKRAEQGFQGAKDTLAQHRQLYQRALESGAGTRDSFIEQVKPDYLKAELKAKTEMDPHVYAAAARAERSAELQPNLDYYNRRLRKRLSGGTKKKVRRARSYLLKEREAQEEAIAKHGIAAQGAVSRLADKAANYNLFFGGTPAFQSDLSGMTVDDYRSKIAESGVNPVYQMLRGNTGDSYQKGLELARERVYNLNPMYTEQPTAWELTYGYKAPY